MADSWEDVDFDSVESGLPQPTPTTSDRWEGEDEEEPTKDAWDDDDEENKEKTENDGAVKAVQVKKKKKIQDTLREKKEKKQRDLEQRKKEEEERLKELSPEEEIEEKLRRKTLQEESDLQLAKEAFGVVDDGRVTIDSFNPVTDEEFKEFGTLLKEKIMKYAQSAHYVDLLDDLFQACSLDLDSEQVKRLGVSLTAIASEKLKVQKAAKPKKKTKKAVLSGSGKSSRNADLDAYHMGDDNDLADFM